MSGTTALGFVYPTSGDQMCQAAGIAPPETPGEALADSIAAWLPANISNDYTRLAGGWPRVKVSRAGFSNNTTPDTTELTTFDTLEFNHATPTDLGLDNGGIYLTAGIWVICAEFKAPSTTNLNWAQGGSIDGGVLVNASNANEPPYGGGYVSTRLYRTGLTVRVVDTTTLFYTTGSPLFIFHALTAFQIADYF
jgi:hypothetical protein